MADKEQSIADVVNEGAESIVKYFQGKHHKEFPERIKAMVDFHSPDLQIQQIFENHAAQVGSQAYTSAVNYLQKGNADAKVGGLSPTSKLTTENAASILEMYVDSFLDQAVFGGRFKKVIEQAKKRGITGQRLRELKGELFSHYHRTEEGAINPLTEQNIKKLEGKNASELESFLRTLRDTTQKTYTGFLIKEATAELVNIYDRPELSDFVEKRFKKAGLVHPEHKETLLTRQPNDVVVDLSTYLHGGDMQKRGYVRKEEAA